jgi:hypothetical protein
MSYRLLTLTTPQQGVMQFHGFGGQMRVSERSLKKFKQRARELLNRNHGKSTRQRMQELTCIFAVG